MSERGGARLWLARAERGAGWLVSTLAALLVVVGLLPGNPHHGSLYLLVAGLALLWAVGILR